MMDAFIEFTSRENEEEKLLGRPQKEKNSSSKKKKADPLHLCTHFTLKTLYKHKERKTAAPTSRLLRFGVKYNE